ncbi:hypothetical protein [Sphingomonas sp.]|uniref:hypothetical protein n=1 Tax=Sphingomonas sp. TaxID=28214 RepID=UPI000DB04B4E|nr:hypothetical protein [Sphingomonas sp.]PZU10254.1 MAG: hypothetical protein DI605_06640 [Sphingomonas sp.]
MKARLHLLVRGAVCVAACVSVVAVLGHRPRAAGGPQPPAIVIRPIATGPASDTAEPLFADPRIDAIPAAGAGGLPQLLGIVGRLSDPLVMVRGGDGAVRTIGKGGVVDGWTLGDVSADRATFRRGGEQRVAVLPPRDAPEPPQ